MKSAAGLYKLHSTVNSVLLDSTPLAFTRFVLSQPRKARIVRTPNSQLVLRYYLQMVHISKGQTSKTRRTVGQIPRFGALIATDLGLDLKVELYALNEPQS